LIIPNGRKMSKPILWRGRISVWGRDFENVSWSSHGVALPTPPGPQFWGSEFPPKLKRTLGHRPRMNSPDRTRTHRLRQSDFEFDFWYFHFCLTRRGIMPLLMRVEQLPSFNGKI